MTQLIIIVVLVALLASFLVLLLTKWGVVEWMQVHGDTMLSKMASCSFCLSFWACVLCALVFVLAYDDVRYVFVPFFAAPLTRNLVTR